MEPYYDPQESHVNQIASGAMWQDLLVRFQQAERLTQSEYPGFCAEADHFGSCGLEGRMGTTCSDACRGGSMCRARWDRLHPDTLQTGSDPGSVA